MSSAQEPPLEAKRILYQTVNGIRVPLTFNPDTFREAISYAPKPDDFFLVSYPKCGTTWLQYIIYHICNKCQNPDDALAIMSTIPFMERDGMEACKLNRIEGRKNVLAYKFHLPYELMPQSPQCKYIYIARNPLDTFVSYYHFYSSLPIYNTQNFTFDEFFESVIRGECPYGDYFDHLLSWYRHREDRNVLFLTYESMKQDHKGAVLKISQFLGKDSSIISENLLEDIVKYSGLAYMKETLGPELEKYLTESPALAKQRSKASDVEAEAAKTKKPTLIRKGIVGDWKNHMSEVQRKRLIARFEEKCHGSDVHLLWPDLFRSPAYFGSA